MHAYAILYPTFAMALITLFIIIRLTVLRQNPFTRYRHEF